MTATQKTALLLISILLYSVYSVAQSPGSTYNLEVTVVNLKNTKGKVMLALFDSEEAFLEDFTTGKEVKIEGEEVVAVFENLSSGTYAMSVFHDENENKELDSNKMGIPKEPYGFSNNARGLFGPAKFEDAKFELSKNLKISIEVK